MLRTKDLTNPYDVERLHRSVAMLSPREPCLDRDEALQVLDTIIELQRGGTTA